MPDKKKILVVEDEGIIAKDIAYMLETLVYEVVAIVTSGEDAITAAEKLVPDLILMDIMLSGRLNGIETAVKVQHEMGIPVVFLTAHSDERTLQKAVSVEAYGYLLKPFDERELHSTIELVLKRHHAEKALRESEEKYRLLFTNASEGIMTLTTKGRVLDVNPRMSEITGYGADRLKGLGLIALARLFKVEAKQVLSKFGEFMAGNLERADWCITTRAGERITITVHPSKIVKNGTAMGISVMIARAIKSAQLQSELMIGEG